MTYIENPAKIYGCYTCGEMLGDYYTDEFTDYYCCSKCKAPSIITFQTALDTMLMLQQQGVAFNSQEYDAGELEYDEETNDLN